MEDCIFCRLAKDKEKIVMESELNFAVFDIRPISPGHSLIIPKSHYRDLESTPTEVLQDAMILVKRMVEYLRSKHLDIRGIKYISNQGSAADQVVFHLHIHIIPKY